VSDETLRVLRAHWRSPSGGCRAGHLQARSPLIEADAYGRPAVRPVNRPQRACVRRR
jgi:hypothetical protein